MQTISALLQGVRTDKLNYSNDIRNIADIITSPFSEFWGRSANKFISSIIFIAFESTMNDKKTPTLREIMAIANLNQDELLHVLYKSKNFNIQSYVREIECWTTTQYQECTGMVIGILSSYSNEIS